VDHRITVGNEPLDETGLVAFTACGHWWVYPVRADPEPMHELARFNLVGICSFCIADWRAATHVLGTATTTRIT
jgi:hypothetical protein